MNVGKQVVVDAIATQLAKLMPGLDTDYSVIAAALIEGVELAAVAHLQHREQALQQVLGGLTDYYGKVIHDAWEQVAQLKTERADLMLKLAARGLASVPDTKPTSDPSAPIARDTGGSSRVSA